MGRSWSRRCSTGCSAGPISCGWSGCSRSIPSACGRVGRCCWRPGGELAEALLSASSGLPRVRDLRGRLEAARDAVAPQRKSAARPFYRGLDGFVEARKLKRQEALRPEAWQQLVAELAELEEVQAEAGRALPGLSAELARLDRVRLTKPLLLRLDGALEWLDANSDAPVLPAELGARLATAREALHRATEAERGVAVRRQGVEGALAEIVPDAALLERGAAIDALAGEAATARQAGGDLPAVRERLAETLHEIERLLRDLRAPVGRAGAAELLPDAALQARARTLLTRRTAIDGRLEGLPEILAGHAADRAQHAALLESLPPAPEAAGLVALVREIRAEGDPAQLADDAAAEATARCEAATTALALVPGGEGDRPKLAALTPDLPARYDRAYEALVDARRVADARSTATGTAREAVAATGAEIARLLAGEVPADAAELARARTHRDRGWDLVFRSAFSGEIVSEAEIADWTGGVPLPVAYGRAVAAADGVADRRVLEAAMLDRLAQARLRLAATETDLAQGETLEAAARLALAEAEAAWASALAPLGFSVETAASEIREFLLLRTTALAAAEDAALADARQRRLAVRHAAWSRRLAEPLGRAERDAAALLALLHEAEHRIEQARAAETRRSTVLARLDAIERQIAQAEAKQEAGRRELAAWQSDWAACLGALRRSAEETPAELQSVLDLLARLREALREAEGLEDRVRGMEGRIAAFEAHAATLVSAVAAPLVSLAPLDAADRLRTLLAAARTAAAQREELTRQFRAVLAEQERATEALREARATAAALVAAIGGADLEAAEARLRLATERARQAALRDELEAQLLGAGGGQLLDGLRAEADAIAPDALDAALDATRERQQQAIARLQATAAEAERRRSEMEQLAAADTTARAAAQGEAALATLGRALEEALVTQAAVLLLEQGLAEVEAGGDNRLVARIGETFRRLTRGTYAGLRVSDDGRGRATWSRWSAPFPTRSGASTTSRMVRATSFSSRSGWWPSSSTSRPRRRCPSSRTTSCRPSTTPARWRRWRRCSG